MKTSKSSVFISGIDDVEKVFSYPHPAVKQMDYQVEVPELAHSGSSYLELNRPKAMVWTPPHLKRHLGAKLEFLSTSEKEEGVHHEDYPSWGRFGKECISSTRCRSQ